MDKSKLEQLKEKNRLLSQRKKRGSNRLFQACIQTLNTVSVVEDEEMIRQMFLKAHANDTYSQIECKLELLAGKDYYIIWDNAELPIIKCKGKDILMCVDDVFAVSFDTYIVAEDFSECFHSDDMGKVWRYDEVMNGTQNGIY